MNDVLVDLSLEAMADANEANWYATSPISYGLTDADVHNSESISWCITNIPLVVCNIVFKARLRPEHVDSTIETLVEKARARNVPLRWLIGKDTEPPNLGERLLAHGFTILESGPLMAIDLHSLLQAAHLPGNVTISKIKDGDQLEAWCRIVAECFGIPPKRAPAMSRWFKMMDSKSQMCFYLAFQDGEPVATSQLFAGEGVAGIYYVATLPKARNQGIGYAVTHRALQDGLNMGYRVGTLQATPIGESLYLKMGFKEVRRMTVYHWRQAL